MEKQDIIEWLQKAVQGVRIQSPERVVEYLTEHADLIDVLASAVSSARKYFPDCSLVLSVCEHDDSCLELLVRLRHYGRGFMSALQMAEEEWIGMMGNRSGWIQMTTDFVPVESGGDYAYRQENQSN